MTRIIFVRHGETEANRLKIVQGRKLDHPLNEVGLSQAELLAKRLADEKIHHIYTSPQRRAYQTAEAISKFHPHTPLTVRIDLAETSMGRLDGMLISDLDKEYPNLDWDDEVMREKVGAESNVANYKHFSYHWPAWLKPHDGKTILISTHGGKLKALLRSLANPEYLEWINREHPQNTSLAEIEWTPETGGRLTKYNDTTHLTDTPLTANFHEIVKDTKE